MSPIMSLFSVCPYHQLAGQPVPLAGCGLQAGPQVKGLPQQAGEGGPGCEDGVGTLHQLLHHLPAQTHQVHLGLVSLTQESGENFTTVFNADPREIVD